MKCNVVRDLLPLYLDQLCEEETCEQIGQHLDSCEECRRRWKEMGSPVEHIIDQVENETVSIEPMKKYQKKMKRKNKLLLLIILLSVAVVGVLSYLSYGQIRHTGQSFETISQYIRFTHIGKEFAKGNLEPLLSSLAIVGDDPEYAYYTSQAYGDDEEAYIQDTKEYIRNRYGEYFQGKSLKLRKVVVQYHTNLVYQTRNLLVGLVYEIDGVEYYIRLERKGGEGYYVTQDEFVVSTEPITYTAEVTDQDENTTEGRTMETDQKAERTDGRTVETDQKAETTEGRTMETDQKAERTDDRTVESDDEEEETLSVLLETQESLFQSLPPFDNLNFFIAKRMIRKGYQEYRKSGETLSPSIFMTSLLYTTEECLQDGSRLASYHESMREQAEKIIQQNYWIQDIQFNLLSFDKEKHMFRYRVSLFLIQIESGEECVLSVECYRNLSRMVVIPGTEKLIGENIPEDAREIMLDLWKMN